MLVTVFVFIWHRGASVYSRSPKKIRRPDRRRSSASSSSPAVAGSRDPAALFQSGSPTGACANRHSGGAGGGHDH